MATRKTLDINPVFNHRKSIALVDTAEELVESLDNLSVCLKHIEEKYVQEEKSSFNSKADKVQAEKTGSLYEKLKENLEVARDLTDTLKREKWRLSRREMSVELRMDELEEYKSHLKRDMTDMNQTVDVLSVRIVQLENALCEAQEIQEDTDAHRKELAEQLEEATQKHKEHEEKQAKLHEEIQALKEQRKDSVLRQHSRELNDKMEIMVLENHRLKEIIRERDEREDALSLTSQTESETSSVVNTDTTQSQDNCNNLPDNNNAQKTGNSTVDIVNGNASSGGQSSSGLSDNSQHPPQSPSTFTETTGIAYV